MNLKEIKVDNDKLRYKHCVSQEQIEWILETVNDNKSDYIIDYDIQFLCCDHTSLTVYDKDKNYIFDFKAVYFMDTDYISFQFKYNKQFYYIGFRTNDRTDSYNNFTIEIEEDQELNNICEALTNLFYDICNIVY